MRWRRTQPVHEYFSRRYPFVPRDITLGNASLAPMLPQTLVGSRDVTTSGLIDSGAAINVLPYTLGVELGFNRNKETRSVQLSGNMAAVEARGVVQLPRNFSMTFADTPQAVSHLILDHDRKFSKAFDGVLEAEGTELV